MPLTEDAPPVQLLRWAERAVATRSRVVRCRLLPGGITSAVHLLQFDCDGEVREFVLKRWMEGDPAERRGWIDREARILELLEAADIPAPRYVASTDGSADSDVPALLMTRLPGSVWLTPTDPQSWLRQIACTLVRLHEMPPLGGLPETEMTHDPVRTPPDSLQPKLWQRTADVLCQPEPPGAGLIHGDYQHFNLLWQDDRLSGVVDWTWTGIGHPDRDVGHCRLNLAVLFTPQWAQDFVAAYESEAGRRTDPWWNAHELAKYSNDNWQQFIPIQVAGRVEVDTAGMTARVEQQLEQVTP